MASGRWLVAVDIANKSMSFSNVFEEPVRLQSAL